MFNSLTRLSAMVARGAAIAVLATGLAAPSVRAQEQDKGGVPTRALEEAIESSTDAVLLPTSQPGTLTFRNCAAPCKVPSLEVNSQAAFFIGAKRVAFTEFAAYVRSSGPLFLTVFYTPGRTTVTRLVVMGQAQ